MQRLAPTLLLLLCVSPWSAAQMPDYPDAVRSAPASERDDLVVGIWQKLREGKPQEAVAHSRRLLSIDPNNALACAALIEARAAGEGDDSPLNLGRRGLRAAGDLKRPGSMNEDEFAAMQQRVRLTLNTAVGQAYLDRGDAVTARRYLKEAVALAPWSGQHTYLASRAFLEGRNADKGAAFWLLARTVVITNGTKSGEQIAQYAWDNFLKAGGNRDLWVQYLERASSAAPRLRDEAQVASATRSAPSSAVPSRQGTSTAVHAPSSTGTTATTNAPSATSTAAIGGATNPQPTARSSAPAPAMQTGKTNPQSTAPSSAPATPTQTAAATVPPPPAVTPTAPAPTRRAEAGSASVQSDEGIEEDLAEIERSQPRSNGRGPSNGSVPAVRSNAPRAASQEPPELPVVAENIPPKFPSPSMRRPALSASAPLSLGVLIQAHVASKENRVRVVYALSDMLRHLRENDEAFVVSYGKDVGLEQDLTWNYDLLEKAMDRIGPQQGAALLDAVSFSSGHLKRIAKNPNRVLLVISDGSNDWSAGTPLDQSAEIMSSGARIYCIGVGVQGAAERNRLLELASRTGGRATFIDDPNGFRSAAHEIASNLGIDFPE